MRRIELNQVKLNHSLEQMQGHLQDLSDILDLLDDLFAYGVKRDKQHNWISQDSGEVIAPSYGDFWATLDTLEDYYYYAYKEKDDETSG